LTVQRRHQTFECRTGGKHNACRQQERFGAVDQLGGVEPVESKLGQTVPQASFRIG
jgi:hypothetical protein